MKTVVALIRVSGDSQDTDRQRQALKRYEREEGEQFNQWVEDKLSRDLSQHRPEFQKLIKAIEGGKVRRVVIEEFERFGVSGGREFNYYAHIFERHNCELISIKEGNLLANSFGDQVQNLLRGEASKERQIKTGYATQSKKIVQAKTGQALGGIPNWGFDKGCFNAAGVLQWRLHYITRSKRILTTYDATGKPIKEEERNGQAEAPRKAKNERLEWIPTEDESRIEDVRQVFKIFTSERISTIGVAKRMNATRGPIYGHLWNERQVEQMLMNPIYKGDAVYFRSSVGRFIEVRGEKIVTVEEEISHKLRYEAPRRGKKRRIQRTRTKEEWTIKEGHFTSIVDEQTWEEAQTRLANRDKRNHPPRNAGTWLAGLLHCGGCGAKMYAYCQSKDVHGYQCQTYARQYRQTGNGTGCSCGQNTVRHDAAVKLILDKLQALGVILDTFTDQHEALAAAYLEVQPVTLEVGERTRQKISNAIGYAEPLKPVGKKPTFSGGTGDEIRNWGRLTDYLAERFPNKTPGEVLTLLQIDATEATNTQQTNTAAELKETEAEFGKWVSAKVHAESDDERAVIAGKLRELKAKIDMLREQAKPDATVATVFERFASAVASIRSGTDGDKLRLADAVGKVFSKIVLHFERKPWGSGGTRFRYHVLPEKTEFCLSSENASTLLGT